MKRGFVTGIATGVLTGCVAIAAAAQGAAKTVKVEPRQPRTVKVEVPVDQPVRSDTPAFRGEGWFQQQCSVCHVGLWEKQGQGKATAPSLAGVLKGASPDREAAVRAYIQKGSQNMPGFQNTFTSSQFEELITYLKTL